MSVTIPLGGKFALYIETERFGTIGDVITEVVLIKQGETAPHYLMWHRITNESPYHVETGDKRKLLRMIKNYCISAPEWVNPPITTPGIYDMVGTCYGSFSGNPLLMWKHESPFVPGSFFESYHAGTGILENPLNEVIRYGEVTITA